MWDFKLGPGRETGQLWEVWQIPVTPLTSSSRCGANASFFVLVNVPGCVWHGHERRFGNRLRKHPVLFLQLVYESKITSESIF